MSVFEQGYFIDEKNIVKSYEHPVDNEVIREMVDILRHVAADPKERRALEAEWLAMKDEEEYEQALKTIAENQRTIAKKDETIAENRKTINKLEDENIQLRRQLAERSTLN